MPADPSKRDYINLFEKILGQSRVVTDDHVAAYKAATDTSTTDAWSAVFDPPDSHLNRAWEPQVCFLLMSAGVPPPEGYGEPEDAVAEIGAYLLAHGDNQIGYPRLIDWLKTHNYPNAEGDGRPEVGTLIDIVANWWSTGAAIGTAVKAQFFAELVGETVALCDDADARYGTTALLHEAANKDYGTEAVRALLDRGATVDIESEEGETPLALALRVTGGTETVILLIEHGASIKKALNGKTQAEVVAEHPAAGAVFDALRGRASSEILDSLMVRSASRKGPVL